LRVGFGSSPCDTAVSRALLYDKVARRIEISATVSEAVAKTFQNADDLPEEVVAVAQRDIAAARFVPQSDARIVETMRLPA
jgi:hypothetical protein